MRLSMCRARLQLLLVGVTGPVKNLAGNFANPSAKMEGRLSVGFQPRLPGSRYGAARVLRAAACASRSTSCMHDCRCWSWSCSVARDPEKGGDEERAMRTEQQRLTRLSQVKQVDGRAGQSHRGFDFAAAEAGVRASCGCARPHHTRVLTTCFCPPLSCRQVVVLQL